MSAQPLVRSKTSKACIQVGPIKVAVLVVPAQHSSMNMQGCHPASALLIMTFTVVACPADGGQSLDLEVQAFPKLNGPPGELVHAYATTNALHGFGT